MLTSKLVARSLGLALLSGLATVSCGDDDDDDNGSAGSGGKSVAGTSSGGHAGSKPTAGSTSTAGAPEGGNAAAGAEQGGATTVGTAEVLRRDLTVDSAGGAGGAGGAGDNVDPNLINAWGISFDPDPEEDTRFWVSAADSGVSTVYASDGTPAPLVVTIPAAASGTGSPTGQVYNPTTDFEGDKFIFATEDGLIAGWQTGAVAVKRADLSADGASYKGLALIEGAEPMLVAANFYAGTLDAFDKTYAPIDAVMFVDPKPVAGYAPFNVTALGDKVYAAFAKQNADKDEEVAGAGLGYVDAFNPDGSFDRRLIAPGGALNAPWGLALAPAGFSPAPGALLVGNFGDGMIHSYDASTGEIKAVLSDADGNPIAIDGLWALAFGPAKDAEDLSNNLYFTAGPDEETHGLFGVLTAP